jgi:hypothetical protein
LDSTQKAGWDKLRESMKSRPPVSGAVDLAELKKRQAWAESNNTPTAVSRAGAVGIYQIMPAVKKDYVSRTGHEGSLEDPVYNEAVRD